MASAALHPEYVLFDLDVSFEYPDDPGEECEMFDCSAYATTRFRIWSGGAIAEEHFGCDSHEWEIHDALRAEATHYWPVAALAQLVRT